MVSNSKILVAGGSGFIGANLISKLVSSGNKVVSISKIRDNNNRKIENVNYIYHDLRNPIKVNEKKDLLDVEYIVNCSGYINHKSFFNDGRKIFENHIKTVNSLVELAIELKVKTFVQLGSSDEYGLNTSPIKESVRESPLSPYALGKLTYTHFVQQCYKKGLLNTVVLRPFLVFGEMQNKDRFLPYLINNCIKNRNFNVSKGEQIRDYLYVKDFNEALIKSFNNKNVYGEVINIASGKPITIKNLIQKVRDLIGKGNPIYGGIDYREGESMKLYANIEKANKLLKWQPRYEFQESLKKVINWYLKNE